MTPADIRKRADTYNNEDGIIMRALADVVVEVIAHNQSCADLCGHADQEAVRCGYRPYFIYSGRRCPTCPRFDVVAVDALARVEALKP